ncbi:MAG: ABC transporter ATP-binding protein [Phycisphaeraceae bacterium]|nr:MAG: ABC transporter ATP-binding protein [Phycisphaeraceae bacterium]
MPDAGLRIESIGVRYGAVTALDRVSLTAAPGEHIAIIGPSGSGKSTLLRCAAGLVRPGAGAVRWGDEVWSESGAGRFVQPERRKIGMITQSPALWPHLSARKHMLAVLRWRGVRREARSAEADRLLEIVGITARADHRPAQLSGGEAQRLALARALAGGSRLLLLDEPLGQLDAPLRRSLAATLRDVAKRMNAATLHVTHDPAEALRIADRVVALVDGRIVQEGAPDHFAENPESSFVRSALGNG